ncbi:hypothetical protein C0Q70_11363 [Pomacea canaliculata]|uniref:RING-type domain-containing protein n=1 Tax=Pomacea canaliculata TaxID=400727 RepID=A0A2T7P5T3_POMCA|nr:hypothetical protein C0Q70_11363 [Pomacea canaliculata]
MMLGGKVGTNLASSPDVRKKVKTNDELQMDCEATDQRGSNLSLSSSTEGGASAASQPSSHRLTALKPNPEADLRRLVETNRRLRERRNCRLCRQRSVDTIFLPCGHICTCESCAKSIKICILCRKSIRGTAHVYLD